MTADMTQEEAQQYRSEVAAQVFDGAAAPAPEPETTPEDPWAGVNPALRQTFESMQSRVGAFDTVTERLKQAEQRIGSLTNQIRDGKIAAEEKLKATPTKEEIDAASKSQQEWDTLKEEFPEWAEAVDKRFEAQKADLKKELGLPEGITEKLAALEKSGANTEEITALKTEFRKEIVSVRHPNWEATVKTPEFKTFFDTLDADTQKKAYSEKPADAIQLLDLYHDRRPGKTSAEIAADRQDRLRKSETHSPGRKRTPTKAENDMSDEEYRKKIASEVWK